MKFEESDREITPQQFHKDELLAKYREASPYDPDTDTEKIPVIVESLDEVLQGIATVTAEWRKGGGSTPAADVLRETQGLVNEVRDERVRSLELPLAHRLLSLVDEIPSDRKQEILQLIDDRNIRIWDDGAAYRILEEVRKKLSRDNQA